MVKVLFTKDMVSLGKKKCRFYIGTFFIQKNIAVAGGIFECPERKERRKRNGHSKLSKMVGVQGPEERECRRESESLGPNSVTEITEVKRINPSDES